MSNEARMSYSRSAAPPWQAESLSPPDTATPKGDGSWHAWLRHEWPLAVFCVCVGVIALLYNVSRSPDILYDETAYTWAAQQVAQGWRLTLDNQAFFVHPPLMFLLQAGWLHLTGEGSAPLPSAIRSARILAASVGVVDVLLVAALTYQLTASATARRRRTLTAIVAVLTALDPVLVRYDRQDVLEPFALCTSLLVLYAAWTMRNRGTLAYVSVTSLLTGLSLLTNQITIFVLIVPIIFALLQRDRILIRRSAAALGIGLIFSQTFLIWGIELGLGGDFIDVQTTDLRRLAGLLQITGLNMPGVSLTAALERSVTQYSSSYVVIAIGFLALIWCLTRRNNECGNFLTAWLTASYAFGAYIAAIGTLNEQFFVYLLPATIVGTVMFGDALTAAWTRRIVRRLRLAHRQLSKIPVRPLITGAVCCSALACLSAVSWIVNYTGPSDGVVQVDHVISSLPPCSAVNASGDAYKYSYLLGGRAFTAFSVGPAALADSVHYFILAPTDAIEHSGNMSPTLSSWIQANGKQLYSFPSQVYKTVQLWYVPVNPYDPAADTFDIADGLFVNTIGSHCGGYSITNNKSGDFYSGYMALGGKGVIGNPLSRVSPSSNGDYEQLFNGAVLVSQPNTASSVQPLPIVALLESRSPAVYKAAKFPPIVSGATAATRRSWLTNEAITSAYLGGDSNNSRTYAAAVQRFGLPLGPPLVLPGGKVSQAFADVILETSPGQGGVRAAAVTQKALAAGILRVSAMVRKPQTPPSLQNPLALGPPQPTSIKPFVLTLGVGLLVFGFVVGIVLSRRRHAGSTEKEQWWDQ